MIKLISDLPFIIAMLIFIAAFGRGFFLPLLFARNEDEYGWAVTIGFFNVILVFLFAMAGLYVSTLLGTNNVFQIIFLIFAIATYLFSVKVEKATLDYCVKKGILLAKE
nr:hypothetical protein [uncultured Methanolobus sp.]